MQGTPGWYTPPSSALHHDPNNSNYFYNYNQWNRPSGNYDTRSYSHQQPISSMRAANDFGTGHQSVHMQNTFDCHPMFYRQTGGGREFEDGHGNRARSDRTRASTNTTVVPDNTQSNYNKPKNFNSLAKPNESEAENFSYVFTQSLTSLYSNDGETNFTDDSDRTGNIIPIAKIKTEDISNECTQEYSYASAYDPSTPNANIVNFENVKIKTEPYSRDNIPSYESYDMNNMFVRRRRGTLAEAYSRKRKHSAPAGTAGTFDKPIILSPAEDKAPRVFQSESQWIPNSISTCEQTNVNTYQQPDLEEKLSTFDGGRFNKRHPMKSRTARARAEHADMKPASACKKVQKKISPLTVYAKVVDNRIVDVTCRRYKKRSKPKTNEPSIEANVEEPVGEDVGQAVTRKENWKNVFESVSGLLKELVEKVAEKKERESRNEAQLSSLSPQKAKELIFKFCRDYQLDYRDFVNVEDIIKLDVTKQDTHRKKRGDRSHSFTEEHLKKKRGRSSEKEESVDRKPEKAKDKAPEPEPKKEVVVEKPEKPKPKPEKEKPKPKPKTLRSSRQREQDTSPPPARVLRSLPSRQPQPPPARKTRSRRKPAAKSRYPKRNLRSRKNNAAFTKGNKKLKILIDLSKENEQTEVLEVESDASSHAPNFRDDDNFRRKSESDSEDEDEKKCSEDNAISEPPEPGPVVAQDDESTSITIVDQVINLDPVNVSEYIKKEINADCEEDEFVSRQPPQLVRMTDELITADKHEEKDAKCMEEVVAPSENLPLVEPESTTECDPMLDNMPPTLHPNENFNSDDNTENFNSDINDQDQTDQDCDINQAAKSDDSQMKNDILNFENVPYISYIIDNQPSATENTVNESSSEDDCVFIEQKTVDSSNEPAKPDSTPKSLLKEKLLSKSHRDSADGSSRGESKISYYSPNAKSYGKEEQDESILRTLLLESDGVPNSGIGKERESSRISSPFISSLSGLNCLNPDVLKMLEIDSFNSMCSFPFDSFADNKHLSQILQYPLSYHEAYFCQISPEECEQYCANDPNSRVKTKGDTKESILLRKSVELHKIIQKLKEEITYLCDLVCQKDKERLAIICFVRQKEQLIEHFKKISIRMLKNEYPVYIPLKKEIDADEHISDMATTSTIDTIVQGLPVTRSTNSYSIYDSNSSIISNGFIDGAHNSLMNHRPPSIHTPQKVPAMKPSSISTPPEKVSTVATMVAKASENYGLDMTNLRERLRCSPETSVSGNLLQKALSNQSSNSTPGSPFSAPTWSIDRNSPVRNSMTMAKGGAHAMPKSYQHNIPLDMMMNQASRVSPNVDIRPSPQIPEAHRHNIAVPTPIRSVGDQSQIENLLAEPVQMKAHNNSYRSCSMQSGGRYGETRQGFTRPVPNMSRIMPSLGIAEPFPMASTSSSSSTPTSSSDVGENYSERQHKGRPSPNLGLAPMPMKPNYYMSNHHRSMVPNKMSSRGATATVTSSRAKKPEESAMSYAVSSAAASVGPTCSSSSTITSSILAAQAMACDFNGDAIPHCMNCGVIRPRFVCSGCRQHMYCSTRCQTARWPDHSSDCNASMERLEASTPYS